MTWSAVQTQSRSIAGWAAAALGFSLPISTTLDSILLVSTVVAWMISGAFSELPKIIRENRQVLLLPGLFALIAFGMVHGIAPFGERVKSLWKYDDLLLPLVLTPLFLNSYVRERGLWAFGLAMGLTLLISLGLAAGWIPESSWFHGNQTNATVFKLQITHNVLMAFAALLFAEIGRRASVPWHRYGLSLLALGAVIDVMMLVQGRTGQLILCVVILMWSVRHFGIRGLLGGVGSVVVLITVSYAVSPVFQARLAKTVVEIERAQVEAVAPKSSSVGLRLEWYQNTLSLITAHPLFGVGTGSFPRAYAELVTDPRAAKPSHPHNQYLLTAAELGVVGMVALLAVFGMLWQGFLHAGGDLNRRLGQGGLLLMGIGCLLNSLLVDHTEGLFFAWIVSVALAAPRTESVGASC